MTGKRGMEADCCAKNGRITRSNRCDGNQSGNSYEVDCASHAVGQGGEAELPADRGGPHTLDSSAANLRWILRFMFMLPKSVTVFPRRLRWA